MEVKVKRKAGEDILNPHARKFYEEFTEEYELVENEVERLRKRLREAGNGSMSYEITTSNFRVTGIHATTYAFAERVCLAMIGTDLVNNVIGKETVNDWYATTCNVDDFMQLVMNTNDERKIRDVSVKMFRQFAYVLFMQGVEFSLCADEPVILTNTEDEQVLTYIEEVTGGVFEIDEGEFFEPRTIPTTEDGFVEIQFDSQLKAAAAFARLSILMKDLQEITDECHDFLNGGNEND